MKLIELKELIQQKDNTSRIKKVFSEIEAKKLKALNLDYDILKIQTELNLKQLQNILPQTKIEKTGSFDLYNKYEHFQWALNNPGGIQTRWISDIDQLQINADRKEDLNLEKIIENKTKKIKIAVIDSGIDLTHPELINRIHKTPSECSLLEEYKNCLNTTADKQICHDEYTQKDSDNNGYPLDCNGWSFTNSAYPKVKITGNPELSDAKGHGTHVAGIIAAENNHEGIKGILNNVKILPIQVAMNSASSNPIENIAKGLLYAIENKADIVNLSLGWSSQFDLKLMRDLVAKAVEKNILIVVAAGNSSHDDISYPCAYNDVICVGAHDPAGELTSYSNFGTQVDIIAPGDRILSTWPQNLRSKQFTQDNNYEYLSGTSQAAPMVSGALGKLLNLGFSPKESFNKILLGTRQKKEKSPIRFGNIDLAKAVNTAATNLVYPLNKTPFLIKWSEGDNHKFRLKIKNYGKEIKDVSIKITPTSTNQKVHDNIFTISQINNNAIYEREIFFTDTESTQSELYFNLEITTKDETLNFLIKTQFVRLIHSDAHEVDLSKFTVNKKIKEDITIRAFENINSESTTDFFVSHTKKNKEYISVLQLKEGQYHRSRPLPIKERLPVFLNLSKVDIDLDGNDDYVIMYVYIDKDKNKITKFVIIDHNLKPKRLFISPKNTFDNQKTFIPGKFIWLNNGSKMIPAWIGYGEDPTPITNPWISQTPKIGNFFYYLVEDGLKAHQLGEETTPLHFLYQSTEDKKNGNIEFLTTNDKGFKKTYNLNKYTQGHITKVSTLKFEKYFDLFDTKPLAYELDETNAYFHEDSILGNENLYILRRTKDSLASSFINLKTPFKNEAIKFVHLLTSNYIVFQTNHKLVITSANNEQNHWVNSKVNTRRRKYKNLIRSQALYLPSIEAPGMTSEIVVVKNSNELVSHRRYRTLAINDCEEFGLVHKSNADSIGYFCKDKAQILLLNIEQH